MCISDTTYFFSQKQRIQLSKDLGVGNVVDKAINQLYDDRKIDKPTQQALFQSHYEPLKQAVNEGYGKPLAQLEYNSPNYEFLKQLQTNTAVYSMFKSHAAIKDMFALLKNADGNLRSKQDFKTEALKIDGKYRTTYLDAEYDTAVRTARLASQWQKIVKNKKLYPNLTYIHTKSSNPRKDHLGYVGITRPVDDVFWSTHYPPNGWICQCDVEQTDEAATDLPDNLPPVPKEFAFNAGKTGEIFDLKNSGYIQSVPPKEQPALIRAAEKFVNTEAASAAPYQVLYESKSTSTIVEAHPLAFDAPDFKDNFKVAKQMANSTLDIKSIQILPNLEKLPALRAILLPDAKAISNPDFRIDGVVCDMKTPSGNEANKHTITNTISSAHDQGEGIVLVIEKENYISETKLYADIGNKFRNKEYDDFVLYLKYNKEWKGWDKKSWEARKKE